MASYNNTCEKCWESPDEKRKKLENNEENTPITRKRWKTEIRKKTPVESGQISPLSNSDSEAPSFNIKSFYGSTPNSKVSALRKSPRLILEKCDMQHKTSNTEFMSSSMNGFTKYLRKKSDTSSVSAVVNKQKNRRKISSGKNLCVISRKNRIVTSKYKRLPFNVVTPRKTDENISYTRENIFVTKDPEGDSSPATSENRKKFFKNRCPSSSAVSLGSIVIRKGFDLKFVPHRLSGKFMKVGKKVDKKERQIPKNSGKKIIKDLMDSEKPRFRFDLKNHIQSPGNSAAESDILDSLSSEKIATDGELISCSPVSSISWLSEIQPNVSHCHEMTTGSQELFSSDGRSEVSGITNSSEKTDNDGQTTGKKLFPVFDINSRTYSPETCKMILRSSTPKIRPLVREKAGMEQMILDAGQKKFGAAHCNVCGMVYTHADATDETTHAKFHQGFLNALKFPGWKKERVVQEFPVEGSRVIMVLHDDPKYATKKIEEINRIMGQELGFPEQTLALRPAFKAFLYISDEKTIDGCCIAEPITEGYRVIPDMEANFQHGERRPWCCETEPEPAAVGISRIWVCAMQRHKGIATRLVDTVRQCFEYGILIEKEKTAFSDPTPDGRAFATRYVGTESFLVYKYRPSKEIISLKSYNF